MAHIIFKDISEIRVQKGCVTLAIWSLSQYWEFISPVLQFPEPGTPNLHMVIW